MENRERYLIELGKWAEQAMPLIIAVLNDHDLAFEDSSGAIDMLQTHVKKLAGIAPLMRLRR